MSERLGINVTQTGMDLRTASDLLREAEDLGYTDAWAAETNGVDGFSAATTAAMATRDMRIGIAVVPVYSRPPALLAMSALAVQQASGGRFNLGLGASSQTIVENWMGQRFDRPLTRMRESISVIKESLAGEKVSLDGQTLHVKGFRLESPPETPIPIYLGALGPKMLRLADEMCDGVALYLACEEGVRIAAKAAPGKEIVERIIAAPDEDEGGVRPLFKWMFAPYVAVPAYNRFIAEQGFEQEASAIAEAWAAGERDTAREAVSDRLLDAMVLLGPAAKCKERLASLRDAGLSTPILAFASPRGPEGVRTAMRAMAP